MRATQIGGVHPRPQLIRKTWASLDGRWQFAYDDDDIGVRDQWYDPARADAFDRTIVVPYPPESQASGIGDPSFHPVVWYRRELSSDDLLESAELGDGMRLIVHFGAVDFEADIWIDGLHAGRHVGGQTPFEVDVTDALASRAGPHVLVVRAKDAPRDKTQPRGKQDWRPKPRGIWYDRTTGIWQSVWTELAPGQRIVDLVWTPRPDDARVDVQVELASEPETPLLVRLRATQGEEVIAATTAMTTGKTTSIRLHLPQLDDASLRPAICWSPEQPVLIDAQVSLHPLDDLAAEVDEVASYFGIVAIAASGGAFQLNGEPYFVRAVLAQNYWPESHLAAPSLRALEREVELAKLLGFNTLRLHQKAEDPRFLFFADKLGLLIWDEAANAVKFSARGAELLADEWSQQVRRDRSHPCVAVWVPINESWGVPEVAVDAEQQAFVRRLVAETRSLDPTRLVLSNEGWEHVDSDIVGVHDYEKDPVAFYRRYRDHDAVLAAIDGPGPQGRRLALTEQQRDAFVAGVAPVMLTEFGGISYDAAETWGYQTVRNEEELTAVLRALFAAVQSSSALAGFCFTQLTDTRQEANGLLTANREPKLPFDLISSIVAGRPQAPPSRPFPHSAALAARRHLGWVARLARDRIPGFRRPST